MADLVADHRCELLLGFHEGKQAAADEDIRVAGGEGVDLLAVGDVEAEIRAVAGRVRQRPKVVVLAAFGRAREQPLANVLHIALPAFIRVDLAFLLEVLVHLLAGAAPSGRRCQGHRHKDGEEQRRAHDRQVR